MVLKIDPDTGLADGIPFRSSPNCDDRPPFIEVDVLVIHSISLPPGQYGGSEVEQFFLNQLDFDAHPYFHEIRELAVSSHFFIRRNGEILQFVPVHKRAWHAGHSEWAGRSNVNDFSIGIELEGTDATAFDEAQYQSLIQLGEGLRELYPGITQKKLVGHCDIATERKTDPGPYFDWDRVRSALA